MAVLYPAGVFLAADPLLVTVAIVGRGAFGEDSTDSISIKEVADLLGMDEFDYSSFCIYANMNVLPFFNSLF
ncbi:MAG TPA: hypothetical protein DCM73_06930 [Clostridiales bacterium]|nr:hypothetical protein [Clostridiales bacterium]